MKQSIITVLTGIFLSTNNLPVLALASTDEASSIGVNIPVFAEGVDATITKTTPGGGFDTVGKIQWNRYSLPAGQTIRYQFSNPNQIIINYIPPNAVTTPISQIRGVIEGAGGGKVILFNPNGIRFSRSSVIKDLGNFVASTHDITNFAALDDTNPDIQFTTYTDPVSGFAFGLRVQDSADIGSINAITPPCHTIDNVTLFGNGFNLTNNGQVNANNQVQIFAIGGGTYEADNNVFSATTDNTLRADQVNFTSNAHIINTASSSFIRANSNDPVTDGRVVINNSSDIDNYTSSVSLLGTILANSDFPGSGFYAVDVTSNNNSAVSAFGGIRYRGIIDSCKSCASPSGNTRVRFTTDYVESPSFLGVVALSNSTPAALNPGNVGTLFVNNLDGTLQSLSFTDITPTPPPATFREFLSNYCRVSSPAPSSAAINLQFNDCIPPSPPTPPAPDDGGGGGIGAGGVTAIAVGSAGGLGVAGLLSTLPLLAKKPSIMPTIASTRPAYYYYPATSSTQCPQYGMRNYYGETTGAAVQPQQGYYYYPQEQAQPLPETTEEGNLNVEE